VIEIVLKRIKSEVASEVRDGRGEIPRAMESSYSLRRGKSALSSLSFALSSLFGPGDVRKDP